MLSNARFFKEPKPKPKPPVDVGKRFKYLGIEMVCTRHWDYDTTFPVVVAEYVNKHGEIQHAKFPPCDWLALEAELVR